MLNRENRRIFALNSEYLKQNYLLEQKTIEGVAVCLGREEIQDFNCSGRSSLVQFPIKLTQLTHAERVVRLNLTNRFGRILFSFLTTPSSRSGQHNQSHEVYYFSHSVIKVLYEAHP